MSGRRGQEAGDGLSTLYLTGPENGRELFRWVDDRLVQAWRDGPNAVSRQGAIYLGRVVKLEPSLNAAFVEIGLERPGLLPLKKQNLPHEGQAVIVQVKRDAREDKGVRLSASLTTTVDAAALAAGKSAPCCLVPPPEPWQSLLLSLAPHLVDAVICARRIDAERIAAWCGERLPELAGRISHEPLRDWAPSRGEAIDAVAEALDEDVRLAGGGQLLIEPVRTLTAIDVNSAAATGRSGIEQTALAVNLGAAREIPRQLALRNLGGIIVIDFIDLQNRNKRDQVIQALREAVGIDPAIEWVGNMSRLGLVELLRKRSGPSLAEMWRDALKTEREEDGR
ncbi:MAG TPA: ribonuclease E/G [Dongiaceae bacterium]|nr:ribonuclease E/G [Dongiaceae bacterium]